MNLLLIFFPIGLEIPMINYSSDQVIGFDQPRGCFDTSGSLLCKAANANHVPVASDPWKSADRSDKHGHKSNPQ